MLTVPQLQAVKALIDADQALSGQPNNGDGNAVVAAALNAVASPAWVVWRTATPVEDIMLNGFDWARVDNLSVGKARIWDWMTQFGVLNPSKANVRAGIDATWAGTQADLDVRAAVYLHCKKNASRLLVHTAFSTGTGSTASPATLSANVDESYQISPQDVETARNLP